LVARLLHLLDFYVAHGHSHEFFIVYVVRIMILFKFIRFFEKILVKLPFKVSLLPIRRVRATVLRWKFTISFLLYFVWWIFGGKVFIPTFWRFVMSRALLVGMILFCQLVTNNLHWSSKYFFVQLNQISRFVSLFLRYLSVSLLNLKSLRVFSYSLLLQSLRVFQNLLSIIKV